jgi:hypothetical protein
MAGNVAIYSVDMGIIDVNNLTGGGTNQVLITDRNTSGVEGLYSNYWNGNYAVMSGWIGNLAVSDDVTLAVPDGVSNAAVVSVLGVFNGNKSSNDTNATMLFNGTTGHVSNVTDSTGKILKIQNGNSTFRVTPTMFINGKTILGNVSTKVFTLYNLTGNVVLGNVAVDNPSIIVKTVPNGYYQVYASVKDIKNNTVTSVPINVDTIPGSTGGGYSGGGGSTGCCNNPTPNPTPNTNATVNTTATTTATVTASATVTVVSTPNGPIDTTQETPIQTQKKGSPGFEIIIVIGAIIIMMFIMRRKKQ